MARSGKGQNYTTATSEASALSVDYRGMGAFFVSVPTGSSITTITVYAQAITGSEYVPCGEAQAGTAPYGFSFADAFGAKAFKLVADAAGPVAIGFSE